MSTAIGYVETVREDLLDAAWRSTMSSRRTMRRRPSGRWVLAGATLVTIVVAGVVGSQVLGGAPRKLIRTSDVPANGVSVPSPTTVPRAAPRTANWDSLKLAGGNESADDSPGLAPGVDQPAGSARSQVALGYGSVGSINPAGDLSKVIKTGRMSIVVGHDTFEDRFSKVGDIADRLGGYLSSSTTSGGKSGSVTMRIPANRFQEAVRSLRQLGRVDGETIEGADVTADYVDLASRIRIAKARRRVLFGLMRKAVSIDQTIRVQNALDDVQLRIEELQGQLNVLDDRVSQATVRVSMREVGVKAHAETVVEKPSIPNAFEHAVAGFFSVVAAVIVGLGWVLPTLVVLLALWFVVTRVRRRLA